MPHKLSALQDEYEREMMDRSTKGAETLLQQVRSGRSTSAQTALSPAGGHQANHFKGILNRASRYARGVNRGAGLLQAREWESSGEYARAVDCYVKINSKVTADKNIMEKSWRKVCAELRSLRGCVGQKRIGRSILGMPSKCTFS